MRRSTGVTTSLGVGVLIIGSIFGLGACGSAERRIGEFALRNAASVAGSAEFANKGYPLEHRLRCTATVSTTDEKATVACTGTTKDGRPVTLDGQADNQKDLRGSFVGKVGGNAIFSRDCLGTKC